MQDDLASLKKLARSRNITVEEAQVFLDNIRRLCSEQLSAKCVAMACREFAGSNVSIRTIAIRSAELMEESARELDPNPQKRSRKNHKREDFDRLGHARGKEWYEADWERD